METKNVEFFEHIFPLNVSDRSEQPIDTYSDAMGKGLRRSKRQRKETSFGDDFYTYLVLLMQNNGIRLLRLKLNQLRKIILGP